MEIEYTRAVGCSDVVGAVDDLLRRESGGA
jgi:hypothetical protein